MKYTLLISLLFLFSMISQSQNREKHLLNDNWNFAFGYEVKSDIWQRVELPHTWNKDDAMTGSLKYYRGQATYQKDLFIDKKFENKRLFLKFDGVNTVANVFLNGKHIGEHRGGYTAFVFEITDKVKFGVNNVLKVRVSNALQLDVMPLVGDFNFYGGIYRDVNLIITEKSCISLLDHASPGVYLMQKKVSKTEADINAKVLVSNANASIEKYDVKIELLDNNTSVFSQTSPFTVKGNSQETIDIPFAFKNPRLWNGRKDPFMYKALISLIQNGKVIDQVEQSLGLRYYKVDPEKGFFLNGEHLQLRGVCRHQDRCDQGNALLPQDMEEDVAILTEMGSNSIRLSHYPPAPYFYDLLDKNGIVTWSEIPFVGPGGYRDEGFVDQPSFRENGKQQLTEMIRQNFNRPSICFWGLFNELKMEGDNPIEFLQELNSLAKTEDPSRITTAASCVDEGDMNEITDLIAWNKYFGWYGGDASQIGVWADETHKNHPNYKIAVSEYGAGASIYQHDEGLIQPAPNSYWHPEAWQANYHEKNWKTLDARPYIWGTFIWNLFDFGASHRTEGDRAGRNDKGLVTIDRRVKKDAWWFYKANWNTTEPVLYIANRRFVNRKAPLTTVKVYSNLEQVELMVNDMSLGKKKGDYATFNWENVKLHKGENKIAVKSVKGKNTITDACVWVLE